MTYNLILVQTEKLDTGVPRTVFYYNATLLSELLLFKNSQTPQKESQLNLLTLSVNTLWYSASTTSELGDIESRILLGNSIKEISRV